MLRIFYFALFMWLSWMVVSALLTGAVWMKDCSSYSLTRFTKPGLFMYKVYRQDNPKIYWLSVAVYGVLELTALYAFLVS